MNNVYYLPIAPRLPRTRAECLPGGSNAVRPCPFVRCEFALRRDFPNATETCTLDVTDRGEMTLENVAAAIGTSRQYVQQVEIRAMRDFAYRKLIDEKRRYRPIGLRRAAR